MIDTAHVWAALSLAAAIVIGAVWLFRFFAVGAARKHRTIVGSSSHRNAPRPAPKLSVLVAARNEEANIETCITTLLEQDYPDFEVIAINDRSTDRTPDILARLEARSGGRLRVVTVGESRPGWSGKNNAMREGVAVARGAWLLFTDADCRQTSRRTLSVAMAEAQAHHADFLSIIPVLDTPTVWERIIQPICSWVLILWFLPDRVNDPTKRTAYANGAFMLMSRRCYDAIGGHARVRSELNEDIKMARHAKRAGFTLRVCENEDLYRTRMYRTPGEAWRGWSRIFYGSLGTVRRLGISLAMIGVYNLLPWGALAASLSMRSSSVGASTSATWWSAASLAWIAVLVVQQLVAWRYYGLVRVGRIWSLTHGLGSLIVFGILCNAMLKTLGIATTSWRGTTYRHERSASKTPIGEEPPSPSDDALAIDAAQDAAPAPVAPR